MTHSRSHKRSHWPISILSSLASLFNMLMPLFLVRVLTADEIGAFKAFFLYLMLVPAPSMTVGLVNGLSFWAGHGERGAHAIKVTSWLVLLHAVMFTVIMGVCARPLAGWLGWQPQWAAIFAISMFGGVAARFFEEAAICTGRIWTGALFFSGFELVRTLATVAAAWIYRSLSAVFLVHAAFLTIKTVAGYQYGHRLGLTATGRDFDRAMRKAVNRYAFPISLAGLISIPVNYADQLILSAYVPAEEFAYYAIGCLIIPPLLILEHSVTRVVIPEISQAFAEKQLEKARDLYRSTVEQLALVFIPAAVGLAVFAQVIIDVLFTPTYARAAEYLQVFALNYLLLAFPNDLVPRARGESGWILKNFLAFSGVAIVLCYFGTLEWGARGALWGILAAKGAMRGYGLLYIRASSGWRWGHFLPLRAIKRFTMISLLLGAVSLLLRPLFTNEVVWLLTCGSGFGVLYFALLLGWKLPPAESGARVNVVMVSQYLRIGGLERMVLGLCKGLKAEGINTAVFSYDGAPREDPGLIPEFERNGIPVEALQKGRGFSPRVVLALVRKVMRERVRILHSHDLGALIYSVLAKLCSPRRLYLVHTQHSFIHLKKKKRYALYERLFCRFVDDLIVVSEVNRRQYVSLGFDPARITVIENGIDVPGALPAPAQKQAARDGLLQELPAPVQAALSVVRHRLWVLVLSRISPGKGHAQALDLWRALPKELRAMAALVLVGPVDVADFVETLRQRAGDDSGVVFAGPSDAPDRWYTACDIYLSCSEFEGLPLGPLEAVSSGLPLLLSEISGHEFLRPVSRQYPLDQPQKGAEMLALLVRQMHSDPAALDPGRETGLAWVRARYSSDRMCREYAERYRRGALGVAHVREGLPEQDRAAFERELEKARK